MKRAVLSLLILAAASPCIAKYSGGTGDPNTPYQIANAADLLTLANDTNDYNKCFIMTADVNLDPNLPGNQVFATAVIARDINNANYVFDGRSFTGVFDGNGHRIINLTINSVGNKKGYLGLFGDVCQCEIKNLGLENVFINSESNSTYVGCLAGSNDHFSTINTVRDCFSRGIIVCGSNSRYIGGLIGWNNGNISGSFSTAAITCGTSSSRIGGLLGINKGSLAANCFAEGNVAGGDFSASIGGLIGEWYVSGGEISGCYSTGNVACGNYSQYIGGFVGTDSSFWSIIINCYSMGDVTGGNSASGIGGFAGNSRYVINCYSTGTVSGGSGASGLGGFVGGGNPFGVTSCYFLTSSGPNNHIGTPLTDTQMKQQASFVGWDFVWETVNGPNDIWAICEGVSYPKLSWQFIAGDSDNDKDVDFVDFALMGNKWMQADSNLYCGGSDLTGDKWVDLDDLAVFVEHWLHTQ